MSTTASEVRAHRANGSWRRLEELAWRMVGDAQSASGTSFEPKLGGGTRLMLAMSHRISDDIDLFIRDPQWIGYLTPRLNDHFETEITSYAESASALKFHTRFGEIDFIVGMSLLGLPDDRAPDTQFALEPVAEVLAKKLFYRGWSLTPRDLFDWWAIEHHLPRAIPAPEMGSLLGSKRDDITRALKSLQVSDVARGAWAGIRAPDLLPIDVAAEWAHAQLTHYFEHIDRSGPSLSPAPTPPRP